MQESQKGGKQVVSTQCFDSPYLFDIILHKFYVAT